MLAESMIFDPLQQTPKSNSITFILESDSAQAIRDFNSALTESLKGMRQKHNYRVMIRFSGEGGSDK